MARSGPVRKTLNLASEDYEALEPFLTEGTPERDALAALVGEEPAPWSESATITSLARLGARTVRERLLDRGYRELADTRDADDETYERWARERTEELWRDES